MESQPKFDESKIAHLKHPKPNNNHIGNNQNMFYQTRNIIKQERTGASQRNTVKHKPINVVLFAESLFKLLHMKVINDNLNGGFTHLKRFPESKTKELSHHTVPIVKYYQYEAVLTHAQILMGDQFSMILMWMKFLKISSTELYVVGIIILQRFSFPALFILPKFLIL